MFKHKNINTEKIHTKIKKWRYSIRTKRPNQNALYSVVQPIINSVSASIKSNGARCNSTNNKKITIGHIRIKKKDVLGSKKKKLKDIVFVITVNKIKKKRSITSNIKIKFKKRFTAIKT